MLDKTYRPTEVEARIYERWLASGAFAAQPTGLSRPFETRTYWAHSFRAGINVRF